MKAVFVSLLLLFMVSTSVEAQTITIPVSPSPTPTAQVSYDLPYPGILPDNPLYLLKVTRDRIISFFISDPVKRAKFELLQSDKRLNAAVFLLTEGDKNQQQIADTIDKSTNYFGNAIASANEAKQQGSSVQEVANNLSLSCKKHRQVLQSLQVAGVVKVSVTTNDKRLASYQKQADALKNSVTK